MTGDERFYAGIEAIERFADVPRADHYAPAPSSWALIVTDVRGSTAAIEAGRYRDVNALGVASIAALRNALPDVDLPFVFGGDGATILAPQTRRYAIDAALRGVQEMSSRAFDLEMRCGVVPIEELRASGHEVLVARFRASDQVTFAAFAGSGLTEGERWIKDDSIGTRYAVSQAVEPAADFTGFECRWQPVASLRGIVISLLVTATAPEPGARSATYSEVIEAIEAIVGTDPGGRPIALQSLRLAPVMSEFAQESRIKSSSTSGDVYRNKRMRARVAALVGRVCAWTGVTVDGYHARTYKDQMVAQTDFRKFDETLRMVLDVTPEQRAAIEAMLTEQHARGRVAWGVHASDATLMTCVVDDYRGAHVHFVDGADGGYTLASKQLKRQLQTD